MKRSLTIIAIGMLFTLSSCGSSWNCKKSYCDTDNQNKTIVVVTNDMA